MARDQFIEHLAQVPLFSALSRRELALVARRAEDVTVPAGKVLYETAGWISHPRVSLLADEVAFLDHPVVGDDGGFVAIVNNSGKRKTISGEFASIYGLCWSPGGREVWFTGASVGNNRALRAATRSGGACNGTVARS